MSVCDPRDAFMSDDDVEDNAASTAQPGGTAVRLGATQKLVRSHEQEQGDDDHAVGQAYEITNVPHYHTLTESGKSHFYRPADAIAEFLDNSIQACKYVAPIRSIDISFFFAGDSNAPGTSTGFLVVADNGSGMNVQHLTEFATFSLDRECRGYVASEADQYSISKFGVGAKQAAFYLGNRVRVITKMENEPILELCLDKEVFRERASRGEDVYKQVIIERKKHAESTAPDDEKHLAPLMEAIRKHEASNNHYTILIIRLLPDMINRLVEKNHYEELSEELAEVYHFHLHRTHTPAQIVEKPQFQNAGGSLLTKQKKSDSLGRKASFR